MSFPVFYVPAGDVLPVMFSSYAGSTGASVTLTGLAVTDIEIYKDGSVTQRASDAGYTLLDTDGIDFDGITGVHGFSIDTGDNTDANFYTVGAWFTVVVSSVTVDSQTVNFIACQFRIMPAENAAGVPKVDVDTIKTQAVTCAAGVTVLASVGTAATSTAQTGDSYALANGANGFVAIKGDTAAILADTGTDGVVVAAGSKTGYSLAAGGAGSGAIASAELNNIADAVLDRNMATGVDSGSTTVRTVRQALRALRNKVAISAGTATICKEDDNVASPSWTAAVTTAAGDPISSVDPAGP